MNWNRIARWIALLAVLLAGTAVSACASRRTQPVEIPQTSSAYPKSDLLVEVGWLSDHLDEPDIRIVDLRNPDDYQRGHVPGAVNIPASEISSNIDNLPMEFDQPRVQNALNRVGLTPETTIILYDNLGMLDAARFFWTLEYVGHEDARIVHGGWNAWVAQELEAEVIAPTTDVSTYPLRLDKEKLATAEEIQARLGDSDTAICYG